MSISRNYRCKLIAILLLALILRLALAPWFYHPWEYRTYTNTGNNLRDGINPYTEFHVLTERILEIYEGELPYYEYWAYTPAGLLWLKIIEPETPEHIPYFVESFNYQVDPVHALLLKLPAIAGDFIAGLFLYILARRHGTRDPVKILYLWLFIPLTWFMSSVWGTFDSLVVASILGALLLLHRPGLAGLALGVGATAKIFPAFAGPALWYRLKYRPWIKAAVIAAFVLGVASLYYIIISPGDYIGAVLGFHGDRPGGGLTIYNLWQLGKMNDVLRVVFGGLWIIPMLILWLYVWIKHRADPVKCVGLTFLAFLITSKLVNPVYFLYALPCVLLYIRPMGQIVIWQIAIFAWLQFSIGYWSFITGGIENKLPVDISYMGYLGFGWLAWGLNCSMFYDISRLTTQADS